MSDQRSNQLFTLKSFSRLRQAISGTNEGVSKDDSASTLFRFFRSRHVRDLQLIAVLASYFLLIYVVVVLLFTFSLPAIHVCHNLLDDGVRGAIRHYGGAEAMGIHSLVVLVTYIFPKFAAFVGAALSVWAGVVTWTYLTASTRLGVVDLFACEIGTVCRVGTIFDIGEYYVGRYASGVPQPKSPPAAPNEKAGGPEDAPKGFASSEEYFPVFASNSRDLEALEALVVATITEFYTYMKAVRDLQRRLAGLDPPHAPIAEHDFQKPRQEPDAHLWRSTTANIIYLLFLAYESARKAASSLVEFEPTQAEDIVVVLLTELACYMFLLKYLKDDPLRFARLVLREADYRSEIPRLYRKIDEAIDPTWKPAKQTIAQLAERYEAAVGEPMPKAVKRVKDEDAEAEKKLPSKRRRERRLEGQTPS